MTAERILFYLFALSACGGAIAVVLSQNIVRMGFWLMVSLSSTAALFFLLHADFVAATQLLIYVGGTLVVLIFGVMLTANKSYLKIRMSPGDLVVAGGVAFLLIALLASTTTGVDWDRRSLEAVVLSDAGKAAVQESDDAGDEEYKAIHVGDEHFHQLADADSLSDDEAKALLSRWMKAGLKFAPHSESGGTGRPIGFGLLGLRPDRDLTDSKGLVPAGDGFYVHRLTPHGKDVKGKPSSSSTGYLLPFEIASVHLLVVLIGAGYLARAKRRIGDDETV